MTACSIKVILLVEENTSSTCPSGCVFSAAFIAASPSIAMLWAVSTSVPLDCMEK